MPRRVRIRMACIAIVVIVMASLAANEYVLVHVATLSKSMARLFNPVAVDEGVDEGHVPRSATRKTARTLPPKSSTWGAAGPQLLGEGRSD